MDLSVNAGYSQQGSYSVGSSQAENSENTDEKVTDSTQAAAEPDQATKVMPEALKQASIISEEYNQKLDEKEKEQIKKAVSEMNKHANGTEAIFGIHDKTNRVTIKIVDRDTKKVIKEFPPEETLDMIAKVWELAGILVDEKK